MKFKGKTTKILHTYTDLFGKTCANVPIPMEIAAHITDLEKASAEWKNFNNQDTILSQKPDINFYDRQRNSPAVVLEHKIAALEETEDALATASGMSSVVLLFLTFLEKGDHMIISKYIHYEIYSILKKLANRFGIEFSLADTLNTSSIEHIIKHNTKILIIDTPSNPTLKITDISACSEICKKHGILLVVDNTIATPIFQKPATLGADITLHSTSKYINGHFTALGGAICTSTENIIKLRSTQEFVGTIMSPFNASLTLLGFKTLELRMLKHAANAMEVATFLENHPNVSKVHYPGLKSHPEHELAKKQMSGFSGIVGFDLNGSLEDGKKFMQNLKIHHKVWTFGNVESTVIYFHGILHKRKKQYADRGFNPGEYFDSNVSDHFIRLSVGLENLEDIIADIEQALKF